MSDLDALTSDAKFQMASLDTRLRTFGLVPTTLKDNDSEEE
jgi:hypothetical protein